MKIRYDSIGSGAFVQHPATVNLNPWPPADGYSSILPVVGSCGSVIHYTAFSFCCWFLAHCFGFTLRRRGHQLRFPPPAASVPFLRSSVPPLCRSFARSQKIKKKKQKKITIIQKSIKSNPIKSPGSNNSHRSQHYNA